MSRSSSSKSSAAAAKPPSSDSWFVKAFETYYDPTENSIGPEGIEKLCKAMDVDPSDVKVLVLAWLLRASQMGYFSREEWMSGAPILAVATSPETLLERLGAVEASTRRSSEKLRDLHNFTHVFCRTEGRKKVIAHESAIHMLKLLHADAFPDHVPRLCEFLEQHETSTKRAPARRQPRAHRSLPPSSFPCPLPCSLHNPWFLSLSRLWRARVQVACLLTSGQ
jgi:DCN1-like protein 4/5